MIQINLFVGSRFPVNRRKLRDKAKTVLSQYGVSSAQIDVSVVGERKIKELNESKLKHHGSTDVLSFPLQVKKDVQDFPLPEGMPPHFGDIVISFPEAVKASKRFGKLVDDQLCFYLEHAIMHLLGYHHQ